MKQELIQTFLMQNGDCFDPIQLPEIQNQLAQLDDSRAGYVLSGSYQKPTLILILAILLGWERFFLEDIGMGVVKVLTCYGFGIWWLVDIFSAKSRTYKYNFTKLQQAIMLSR
jgi:TM2 domain-containing membrane protein YozV